MEWNGMELELGKGRLFFNNGIEKGTRNRARGREREMEGTKDITRSYTNFIMYPYQCIYSRQFWMVFPFVAGIATSDVELGSFCRQREGE